MRREFKQIDSGRDGDAGGARARHDPATEDARASAAAAGYPRPRLVETAPPPAIDDAAPAGGARGTAPAFPEGRSLDEMVARVAPSRVSVLITGETGVGKDILARRIHAASPRASRPFVVVNCAAFCESLLDSELFGHQRGAFTGADQSRAGLIEAADGGTVFLDELGELSAAAQAKLLRVIETRFVTRVGSTTPHLVDVRFLAATHRDLDGFVQTGRFRADLLYRLEGIRLALAPLRARPREILPAAARFLDEIAARDGIPRPAISPAAEAALLQHPWPGNFRELRNVMDRAALICAGGRIEPDDLLIAGLVPSAVASVPRREGAGPGAGAGVDQAVEERPHAAAESTRILGALNSCAGNQTRAAKLLGMSRRTLITRLEKHGIARPRARCLRPL